MTVGYAPTLQLLLPSSSWIEFYPTIFPHACLYSIIKSVGTVEEEFTWLWSFSQRKFSFKTVLYFGEDLGGRLIGRPVSERYFSELWVRPCLPLSPPSYSRIIIPPLISQAFWRSFHFLQENFFWNIFFVVRFAFQVLVLPPSPTCAHQTAVSLQGILCFIMMISIIITHHDMITTTTKGLHIMINGLFNVMLSMWYDVMWLFQYCQYDITWHNNMT